MANGDLLQGQQYLVEDDIIAPFTQQMMDKAAADTLVGAPALEITPHDYNASLVRTYNLADIQAAFADSYLSSPIQVSFELPRVLLALPLTCDISSGNGSSTTTADGLTSGESVSLSLSPRSSATSSASVMPDVQPDIKEYWTNDIQCTELVFYTSANPTVDTIHSKVTPLIAVGTTVTVTIASPGVVTWTAHGMANGDAVVFRTTGALPTGLLPNTKYYISSVATNTFRVSATSGGTAINTSGSQSGVHTGYHSVKPWPIFQPKAHTITLTGKSLSGTGEAAVQQSVSIAGSDVSVAYSITEGSSLQAGLTIKTVRIPPTLHGAITLSFPGAYSQAVVAGADVNMTGSLTGGSHWPPQEAHSGVVGGYATASFSPASFSATTPAAVPTSGLYVLKQDSQFYRYGLNQVRVVVVDMAQFS